MFKSLTSRIFITFALLILLEGGLLVFYFGKLSVKDIETYLLDSLSQRAQLKAFQAESDLKTDLSTRLLFEQDALNENFKTPFRTDDLRPLLPPSGSIVTSCTGTQGETYFCSLTHLPRLKAWYVDWTPRETFLKVFQKLWLELLLLALVLLSSALLVAYFLSRLLLSPLKNFIQAADRIAKGAYTSVNLPVHRRDEIGELAQAFGRMGADLRDRERNLQLSALKLAHSERLASIGQIGASIAHEVKNPLTSISGYARLLKSKIEQSDQREAIEVIEKESDRCQHILQQMLRFTRSDPAESKPYSLKEVVQSVHLLLKAEARGRQVELKLENLTDTIVIGSAQQMQQVLLNVMMNALQASPPGSAVKLRMLEQAPWVHVEVEDKGEGIPHDIQDRIFDPFFTTKTGHDGTGLGLSVAKEIVEKQGGSLGFQTSAGQGTVFRVRLPMP
jgi:signal transduction histidine kinase